MANNSKNKAIYSRKENNARKAAGKSHYINMKGSSKGLLHPDDTPT